ncbi:AraC family transcriptional activator of mar-sox-rob regulon [Serratia fonticola]|uniref:AraC family transcriptional activator of mar-sox-rob regulon n=1 Tax=Serratia fonticola TaxID=47917 RepID=A0A542BU79_SERFO|nr:helix-turn-helix domain-containing protein [Serratia fonticola]TQI82166.1 AraC family transcriptional activator of mar-sox-rob regulon [Serratia fonticola]TQI95812.1 AraC family transcriptional activator of mar-sox-rob regulon [Serratia fonticola]TVZ70308.1 AraC family transcriptional activator of mar-sox-rob regulon [Serratia fonticola]
MTQATHITELLIWIENNLRNPLSLDIVSEKSGYSKWYLQRMFRQQTNLPLAAYIRARRLYLAAFSLRFTQKSILDISLEYQFDSQQTFSRCFKKHFGETPSAYRKARDCNFSHLVQSLSLNQPSDISVDYVEVKPDAYSLVGQYYSYHINIEQLDKSHAEIRNKIKDRFCEEFNLRPEKLYALIRFTPDGEQVKVDYFVAVDKAIAADRALSPLPEVSGGFCRFRYAGKPVALHEHIISVYTKLLPQFNLVRREGYDIAQHTYSLDKDEELYMEYEYLIPIVRDEAFIAKTADYQV